MSKRMVVLCVLSAAMVMGVITSGCNRNRDVAASPRRTARQAKRDQARAARTPRRRAADTQLASLKPTGPRPAEVLSVAVRRPSRRDEPAPARRATPGIQRVGPVSAADFAGAHEPVAYRFRQTAAAPMPAQNYAYAAPAPVHAPAAYAAPAPVHYAPPVEAAAFSPQLSMARAALQAAPVAAPLPSAHERDLVVPGHAVTAPIPELEPVRYQRVATPEPARPLRPPPVLMSRREPAPVPALTPVPARTPDVQRALAPLDATSQAAADWVPSPATAMRRTW